MVAARATHDPLAPYLSRTAHEWLDRAPSHLWRVEAGTVVFADVSGFTPLTEKLARRGKIGAEELTDVLNDVFGRLLSVVAAYDGDLIKFGGDALLLLFTGPDHPLRAATCATALHVALRPFRRFKTGGGMVSLGMSVGLETGDVHQFLVGETHREHLIAGPTVSTTVAMENAADSGEVLVGPAAQAALPAALLGDLKGDGRLLSDARASVTVPERVSPRAAAAAGVPPMLRSHLETGRQDGEHRVACLSFLQFKGVDTMLAESGIEATADALQEVVVTAQRACLQRNVTFLATDVDKDGGKILFVTGAPTAGDDDADRLLLALRDSVTANGRLVVRAGANRGRAFAVDVGSPERRTYAVMGDPTNLAARVMGRAEPGHVVATSALLEHVRESFAIAELPPFMVKGKSQPVTAAVVGPPTGHQRATVDELPLAGRRAELEVLSDALSAAWGQRGATAVLEAPPGIGKSRLVREVLARAQDLRILVAEGGQYAVTTPYWALRSMFRDALGLAPDVTMDAAAGALEDAVAAMLPDARPWLPLLAMVFGIDLPGTPETESMDADLRRQITQTQLVRLLDALTPGPSFIVVEDAHWLDDASARLLDAITDHLANRPWFLLATRRPVDTGWVPSDPDLRLQLEPLPADVTAALLLDVARQRPLSPQARQALAERSGGNPLFLRELIGSVDALGDIAEVPDSVEASIAAGLDTLERGQRELLRAASVLGGRFDMDLLGQVLDLDHRPLRSELSKLQRFVSADGSGAMRFSHALVRDVAYQSLPFRRRRALHARAGDILRARGRGADEPVDLLALHYTHARRFSDAWHYARLAGDRALRASAPVEAATFYRWATDAAAHLPQVSEEERLDVTEHLGDVLQVCGRFEEAAAAFDVVRRRCADRPLRRVALLQKSGWLKERTGRYSDAVGWYSRALKLLAELPESESTLRAHAQVLSSMGAMRLRQAKYAEALRSLLPAIEEAESVSDLPTVATSCRFAGWCYTELGDDRAAGYMQAALTIYERIDDLHGLARVFNDIGINAYYRGAWQDALDSYNRAVDVCRRSGDVVTEGLALGNIGEILSDQGRYEEARAAFDEELALWSSVRHPLGHATAIANMARVESRSGNLDAARRMLDEARERLRRIGAEAYVIEVDAREAERLTFAGDGIRARALADLTAARARAMGDMPVVVAMLTRIEAVAAWQSGDRAEALRLFEQSRARAADAEADFELAVTLYTWHRMAPSLGGPDPEPLGIAAAAILDRLGVQHVPMAAQPVTAPTDAEATSLAYFASTPVR